jgi:hypothetical protein
MAGELATAQEVGEDHLHQRGRVAVGHARSGEGIDKLVRHHGEPQPKAAGEESLC